jgi:peptide/nickel transport system substrate-binding protein
MTKNAMIPRLTIVQPRAVLDDPHACTDSGDVLTVFGALFDALVKRGAEGWEPALATGWSMSDDARSTVFTLREGVRFHDGEPCDAEAVKHCLERMARPDMGATLGAPGVYAQYLAGSRVEITGRNEIRLTTAEPLADILDILCVGHIVSPQALEGAGDDLFKRAVGTGPFRLEACEPGRSVTAVAHEGHFGGAPGVGRVTWLAEPDAARRLEALREGSAQVANGLDPAAAAGLDPARFSVAEHLVPTALIFLFNCAEGPAKNPALRRALNLAIDRDALVRDVLGGAGQPLHGYVSPAHRSFDPAAPPFTPDVDQARALMAAAGFGQGVTLELYCPTRLPDEAQALAAAVERQLAPLGVRFAVHLEADRTHYANQVRLKNVRDICVFDSSPMSDFRVLCEKIDSRVKGSWWEGYANPAVEALIDQGRATVDEAARFALYRRAYRLLQDDPPWLYAYNHRRTAGFAGRQPPGAARVDGVLDLRAFGRG